MPELAEVEFYRRQWDAGIGAKVTRVHLHGEKRVFRGTDPALVRKLAGQRLAESRSGGKQMLFVFSGGYWLGIHLGMTGKLATGPADYAPSKHDHLVLFQKTRSMVFSDARQFGRVLVHHGQEEPEWWSRIGPAITSAAFSFQRMDAFLTRRARLAIKAALLLQEGFPGIGNWMADEILWRAKIAPARPCASLSPAARRAVWREARFVSREALKWIAPDFGDVPADWLFHERWKRAGLCPKHKTPLRKETIGGRTTAWCPKCQR